MGVEAVKSKIFGDLQAGGILAGRFHLIRQVGRGGVGVIWLASDAHLDGDQVACKVLKRELSENREALADLKREVLLTRKLRHPNILPVHTFWEDPPYRFITMEYAAGRSLSEELSDRQRPYSVGEVLRWLRQVASALDYAHSLSVLHRDVKPANMLLTPGGMVQLADFGIARTALEAETQGKGRSTKGTLYYMSPEQLVNERLDGRCDLYSLGASAYELLSGSPPFQGPNLIAQIQMSAPAPLGHLNGAMNGALLKTLAKDPADRFGTCGEFCDAVANALEGGGNTVPASWRKVVDPDVETEVIAVRPLETQRSRLGRLLLELGLIGQEDLAGALMEQQKTGDKLGTVLTKMGLVTEEQLVAALSRQLGMPTVRLEEQFVDNGLAIRLARADAIELECIPLRQETGQVVVAMADPLNIMSLNRLETLYGANVAPVLAQSGDIQAAIERVYSA